MRDHHPTGVFIGPGEGEVITAREGRDVILLAEREDLTITRSRYAPGEHGPDPHVHREHVDAFYVVDGELAFAVGAAGEPVRVAAGGFLAVPANVIHSFNNVGDVDARFLNFHAPDGGFAGFLRAAPDGGDTSWDSFDAPLDGGLPAAEAIVCGPGQGERLVSGNRVVHLKAVLPELCFTAWELDGPFDGPHVHHHDEQVDSFFVLEGELEMTVEESVYPVGPGTLASIPRGVRHTFNHSGDGTARVLNAHAPDRGFADFLRRISE